MADRGAEAGFGTLADIINTTHMNPVSGKHAVSINIL